MCITDMLTITKNLVLGFVVNVDHDHSHGLDESKVLSQMTSFADRLRV